MVYTPLIGVCMRVLMIPLLMNPLAIGCGGGRDEKASADADGVSSSGPDEDDS